MAEIQKMSHTHVDILNYMLANPLVRLQDVARNFGYTQPWLSSIIHSDAFQRMMGERQDVIFHHTVLPLKEKMTHLAHVALDKLGERLENENDTDTLKDSATAMLDRIGFSPKVAPAINTTLQVAIIAQREALAEARKLIGTVAKPVLEGHFTYEVQQDTEDRLGSVQEQAALSDLSQGQDRRAEAGDSV